MEQKKARENLLENTLSLMDEEREQIQLTGLLTDQFPSDILKFIFSFLDVHDLLHVILVDRRWYGIATPFLPFRLFDHYNSQTPQAFNDGHLLKALCKAVEQLAVGGDGSVIDLFSSQAQQKLFFQQFMQDVFGEVVDGSEWLFDFLARMSQTFRQSGEQNPYNQPDYEARFAYLDTELARAPEHIHFLFHRAHIEQLLRLYDREENRVAEGATNDDYLFLAQCFERAARLEGFLTTLVVFWKLKKGDFASEVKIITSKRWVSALQGDGLTALHTYYTHFSTFLSLLRDIFSSLIPHQDRPPFTIEEATLLFQKLRPVDILTWVKMKRGKADFNPIKNLLLARSSYLLALLFMGSLAGDMALIYCLKHAWNDITHEFFYELVDIPEVIVRLQTPVFLQRLFTSSLFSSQEKGGLASSLLHRPALIAPLPERMLLDLMCYLRFAGEDSRYYLNCVFVRLSKVERLTSTLLLELAQFGPPADPGKYALSILESEAARALLIGDDRCAVEIAKLAINSRYKETILSQLEKWFDYEKGEKHSDLLYQISFHWPILSRELADEDIVIISKFLLFENFFAFLDRIFFVRRMTASLLSVFLKTFPDRYWREQHSPTFFNLKDIFTIYILSVVERADRRAWLSQAVDVAFAFTQCLFAADNELDNFLDVFSNIIEQFSPPQLAELWCTANPQHQPIVFGFFTLTRWLALWTELHRAVRFCPPIVLENQSFFETQLIEQLIHETSAATLIDGLFQHQLMEQIQSWCGIYPAFLQRLQQPDIYLYVWQRCVGLLTNPYKGEFPPNVIGLLALLLFLSPPQAFDDQQKQAILKQYSASQRYIFCLQLGQKSGALTENLQTLFYPVCLPLLEVCGLQRLQQSLSRHWLSQLFFPISAIEQTVADKLQRGEFTQHQTSWLDSFTARDLVASLLLLLVGTSCLLTGLALGSILLTGVGMVPLLVGIGLLLIPSISTLWYRWASPGQALDHFITVDDEDSPRTSSLAALPTLTASPSAQSSRLSHFAAVRQENFGQKQSFSSTTEFNPSPVKSSAVHQHD